MTFSGQVIFKQEPDILIQSESLVFNKDKATISSNLPSLLTSDSSLITSQSLVFNQQNKSAEFKDVTLHLLDAHLFSTAESLRQINDQQQQLINFHYTSCEPGDRAWELSSDALTLDHKTGLGVAKHAKIYLFDIPIFYFPYFQFPIDDNRHSGLLMPSFTLSKLKGNSLSLPLYWNIHPQLDATIELNINSLRGLLTNTTSRYLTATSEGQLTTASIDDDEEGGERYFYRLKQRSKLGKNTQLDLDIQTVSEQQFFNDFSSISLANVPDFLERHISIKHRSSFLNTSLLLQNHQILDGSKAIAERPYAQWPKLNTTGQFYPFDNTAPFNIALAYINFDRDDSVTAERYSINPSFSKRWSNNYAFTQAEISYSLSYYRISNRDNSRANINRNLATLSIDSGLAFERIASAEKGWLQTLEPRLFFLNTPFKDQSAIPNFDSADVPPSYANLFKRNRFNGSDRIGDTKQLSLGLSSSLLDINSGLEIFRISLGQTFFDEDRLVQLNSTSIGDASTSDLFLEVSSQPQQYWSLSANITRQAETGFITQKTLKLSRHRNDKLFNFSYHFNGRENNTELEQSDISLVYPFNDRWKFFAKNQYSIIDKQNVEQLIGASYDSCCWTFSFIVQESSDADFVEFDRSIYFQLTLKGLSGLGHNNETLLRQSISGYN